MKRLGNDSVHVPRWAQSIRFRLSLAYAVAVFAGGAVLLGALYFSQARQLHEPIIVPTRQVVFSDQATGASFATQFQALSESDVNAAIMEAVERQSYTRALDNLRQASIIGLGLLAVMAFISGWLLSGWTLAPIRRITSVARGITDVELSRRIGLRGPNDELKEVADTFDEMLDRLQSSFEGHRRFVQDASHELRNPLAVTLTNLELVLDDPDADDDELRRAIGIAHASASRIGVIVDDLVAQARMGFAPNPMSDVDLRTLAGEVAAELSASARGSGLALVVTIEPSTPDQVIVHGDPDALARALTNLVVNAIRLAPADSTITISVGCDDRDAIVSVADEGPGIAGPDRESVFDRFWRGRDAGQGLGLGLSIVRQIAERHGGRAELVSSDATGSVFRIVVPRPIRVLTGPGSRS